MDCNAPNLDALKPTGETTWSGDSYLDAPMPDVRNDWKNAKENGTVGGCGLHKNFSYEELCALEESLFERRLLAGVPTPDVLKHLEDQGKGYKYTRKRAFKKEEPKPAEPTATKEEITKELKENLKQEVLKELLAELKGNKS